MISSKEDKPALSHKAVGTTSDDEALYVGTSRMFRCKTTQTLKRVCPRIVICS
jgi:hypothetical protein